MVRKLGNSFVFILFLIYPILLHTCILKDEIDTSDLLWVVAPLLLVGSGMIFRVVAKVWWPIVALLLGLLIYYVLTGEHARVGLLAVNGLSHATLNTFLLWFFGRTLLDNREPLISQIARHINGDLEPEILIYTRQVTFAWSAFFMLQIVMSLLLYVFAPLSVWSLFVNVLNLPLLITMFVAEHAYRTLRFPNHPRTSILKAIEIYTKDFAAPKKNNGR